MSRLWSAVLAVALVAADWPQWRGPNRDGHAAPDGLPARWPDKLAPAWSVEVGDGHGGPVLAGGRVFVHTRQGENEVVRAIDPATGKTVWEKAEPVTAELDGAVGWHSVWPRATPCVADARLFTLSVAGTLVCRDAAAGNELWRAGYARKKLDRPWPLYGAATSPLVVGGRCVVWLGGHDEGALTAFDPATGKVVWQLPGDGPGYSSPVVAEVGGRRLLLTQSQKKRWAVDPETGRAVASEPFQTGYDQNSITPVAAGDLWIDGGYNVPTTARRLAGGKPAAAWTLNRHTLYMSAPVAAGGRLFGLAQKGGGTVFAADARSGKVAWESDGRFGESAALLVAGPFVLVQSVAGKLVVLRADATGFDPVAEYALSDRPTWPHPALAGATLYVKDKTHLHAFPVK